MVARRSPHSSCRWRSRSVSTTPTTTATVSGAPTTCGSVRCGSSPSGTAPAGGGQARRVCGVRGRRGRRAWCWRPPRRGGCCVVGVACDRSPRGATPVVRSRTGTWGSARCSCSCSSVSWRPSAPRTSRSRTCPARRVVAGCGVGLLACALLVVNNLRDIPTDTAAGKRTLAVRLGDPRTRGACFVGARGGGVRGRPVSPRPGGSRRCSRCWRFRSPPYQSERWSTVRAARR